MITSAIHDEINKPTVISLSYGSPEDASDPTTDQINQALQAAAAMGVTVCVASGDNGSSDNPNASSPAQVDFPASKSFRPRLGRQRLTASGSTISSEVGWNEPTGGASGGDVEPDLSVPADYQTNTGVPAAVDPAGPIGRGVPTTSRAMPTRTRGTTSSSTVEPDAHRRRRHGDAPFGRHWSRCSTRSSGSPAFLNPILYADPRGLGKAASPSASNGDYNAGSGWDPCAPGWAAPTE